VRARHPLYNLLQPRPAPPAASERHLRPDEADALLAYLPARGREMLAHWTGCTACQSALRGHLGVGPAPAPAAAPTKRERIEAFELVTAAARDAGRRLDEDFERADAAAAALLATPPGRRRGRVRAEARFQTLGVACRLIHRSLLAETPREAETCARLVIAVVDALDPGDVMGLAAGETKARAWALVAHARWRRWDVPATLRALDEAERALVEDGTLVDRAPSRRALRLLRLVERHLLQAAAAAGQALDQLLGSLWRQLDEAAPSPENGSGDDLEN
jgi:hypothetical protein